MIAETACCWYLVFWASYHSLQVIPGPYFTRAACEQVGEQIVYKKFHYLCVPRSNGAPQ